MHCEAPKLLHGAYLYQKRALRCLQAAWNGFRVAPKWFIRPPKCCRGVRNLFRDAPIWLSGAQFYPCGALKCLRRSSMWFLETVKWFCRGPKYFHGVPILFHGAPNLLHGVNFASRGIQFSLCLIFTLKSYLFHLFVPFRAKKSDKFDSSLYHIYSRIRNQVQKVQSTFRVRESN